jgi:pimeloyl-ACP methyl ester carboxylesterase
MFRCVLSLNGIRTRGVWQKDLVPVLARHGFIPYALDYGSFSIFKFASRRARDRKLEWLRSEYERVTTDCGVQRPSVVAHSFGTYLVAGLLAKYPNLLFDKVIFAGSIVDRRYDWASKLGAGQVNFVRNDYGSLDRWPKLARYLVRDSGASGTDGFTGEHPALLQQRFPKHRHSDYFHRRHFTDYWIPTLTRVDVAESERRRLTDVLDVACQTVAARLAVDGRLVRANIFVPDEEHQLRIPKGLTHNMTDPIERTVMIAPGTGCAGVAYSTRTSTIAIMQRDWGAHTLPGTELAKVDKRLKWIIATPIPDPDAAGGILGVFGVDGLETAKTRDELAPLLGDLLVVAGGLGLVFKELT